MTAPRLRVRQRGVAVITALLLTALAITIVTSLFWQQQVQVRSMENQRLHLQTKWILRGALDWARLILWQDLNDSRNVTASGGVWATPLAETRLDDYVERERLDNEKFDATLSGQITDAQSRYNLANLAARDPVQTEIFRRLLVNLQLNPSLAQPIADAVARGQAQPKGESDGRTGAATGQTLPFMRVEDLLAVSGVTQQTVERLRDYVIVLPTTTKVNGNTASPEVLAALLPNYTVSQASSVVLMLKRSPASTVEALNTAMSSGGTGIDAKLVDVKSNYFLVLSRVRLDRAALDAQALIRRVPGERQAVTLVWIQEH